MDPMKLDDMPTMIRAIDDAGVHFGGGAAIARRLEECRALLTRLAADEQAPEGHTFQSWARELLA